MDEGKSADELLKELYSAGATLISALSEEASFAALTCRHPDDELLYCKWAQARQSLEEKGQRYCECLARCDFPDVKIRALVEGAGWSEPEYS